MGKLKSECSPEEWERQKEMGRRRNQRYLEKRDPDVIARRNKAHSEYMERLRSDPAYADKSAARKRRAVERTKAWQAANPEKTKEHARMSRKRNPAREAAKVQRRNAAKIRATPACADKEAIQRHYANAAYLTMVTGHQHHVDHIIPLRGKTASGLHVENNLRAVPHFINTRKGNKF